MLSKENIENIFALSPMQQGMLVHYARQPDTTAYIEQFDFVLTGAVDITRLQQAFQLVINKYASLRTVFSFRKTDEPRQIVLKERQATLETKSLLTVAADQQAAAIDAFKAEDKARGFDLSQDNLLRATLLSKNNTQHNLIVTFHHIVLDGWCLGIVFGDLFAFYETLKSHNEESWPQEAPALQETTPFSEYISWLQVQDNTAANDYWKTYLADYEAEVGIPYFDMAAHSSAVTPSHFNFSLDNDLTAQLTALAKANQITFNSIFQAAWGLLLQKFNNTSDAVFGGVVSGRPPEINGIAQMVGMFINTLPVRVKTQDKDTFLSLAQRVHQQIFQSSKYEYSPLFEVQKQSDLNNKLMNHVIAFENYPIAQQMRDMQSGDGELSIDDVICFEQTNYDFDIIVNPGDNTVITFNYNSAKFREETMALLSRSLMTLLKEVANTPEQAVTQLSICAEPELNTILNVFNDTQVDYPRDKTVSELFDSTVSAFADNIALSGDNNGTETSYTYQELHRRVLQTARMLQAQHVKAGDSVAIVLPRCPDVLISILGIWYVGAVYVPLDIKLPNDRIAFMIDNAEATVALTHGEYLHLLPNNITPLQMENQPYAEFSAQSSPDLPVALDVHAPAYSIYTSGSTGQPKGCLVSHQNIVRLVKNSDFVTMDDKLNVFATCATVFDVSTFEYWAPLLNGGQLSMYGDDVLLNTDLLKSKITASNANTAWITSALFNQLVDTDLTLFETFQQLVVGGDVVSVVHSKKLLDAYPNTRLVNGYGPTENTTFSSTHEISEPPTRRIPIGKPIKNSTCYVLDDNLQQLPPGAYGELCCGGDGVALGYVKRPELNAKSFLDNPFEPGKRLYRTGDIVRWLPDGTIDLQGRKDFQHKIRGFRIELGEIQWAMTSEEGVSEAIVKVIDAPTGKQLHAWFVSDSEAKDEKAVRQALLQKLPNYMVPSHMLRMAKFPLNLSGKVDRNQLPTITVSQVSTGPAIKPRNDNEKLIADILQDVLSLETISVYDNFFDVGADSLNLMTVTNRLKKALDKDIPITALFEHTTIAKLAEYLNPDEEAIKQKQAQEQKTMQSAKQKMKKNRRLMRATDD